MGFEVSTSELYRACADLDSCREGLSWMVHHHLSQAQDDLRRVMCNGGDGRDVLRDILQSLEDVREQGQLLTSRLELYADALDHIASIYETTEEMVIEDSKASFVDASSSFPLGSLARGAEPSTGAIDSRYQGVRHFSGEHWVEPMVRAMYEHMVRAL